MKDQILKRIISSLFLIPISFFFIIKGNIFFSTFLIILLIISIKEWSKISINYILFYLGVLYLIISFFLIYQIRNSQLFNDLNLFYFFFILIICISTDIGGYLIGNILKGPKLTKISPKKTISGSIGAFFFSVFFLYFYLTLSNQFLLNSKSYGYDIYIIILCISAISQCGDILISFFKRSSKAKDTGNLIPGHGGVLDRIDGMIFAFPFAYLLILIDLL